MRTKTTLKQYEAYVKQREKLAKKTTPELVNRIGRCIRSANDNFTEAKDVKSFDYSLLTDLESDLDLALEAISELMYRDGERRR